MTATTAPPPLVPVGPYTAASAGACCSTMWLEKTTLKLKAAAALGQGAGGTGTSGGAGGSTGGPGAKPGLNAITQPTMHSLDTASQELQEGSWKPGGKMGSEPGRITGFSVEGSSQREGQ